MARDLNLETALWYFFTSPEFYEMGAKECEDLRDMFSGVAVAHGKTTYKRNGQIYDAFNTASRNFRRGVEFAKLDEYNVIYDATGNVQSDIRGMTQWSSPEVWMNEAEQKAFSRGTGRVLAHHYLIQHALFNGLRGGVTFTNSDRYIDRDDGFRDSSILSKFNFYNSHYAFGWPLPSPPPCYEIDQSTSVKTGEVCTWTGVWYPAVGLERHSLVFGIKGYPMPPAYRCDKTMEELAAESDDGDAFSSDIETTAVETIWHPVKLIESATHSTDDGVQKLRCSANDLCPKAGYWLTVAKLGSRRHFKKGDIMPDFPGSSYGVTIWMWDQDQD